MAERIYWDACAWIGLINAEADKVAGCQHCMDLAKEGKVQIWTSALTLAEVFKKKCGDRNEGIEQDNEDAFAQFVAQEFVVLVHVDQEIGEKARDLLRKHSILKKPADAIHLATAAIHDVDAMYTFDKDNLLNLSGLVTKANGIPLSICNPPPPPKATKQGLLEFFPQAESGQIEAEIPQAAAVTDELATTTAHAKGNGEASDELEAAGSGSSLPADSEKGGAPMFDGDTART